MEVSKLPKKRTRMSLIWCTCMCIVLLESVRQSLCWILEARKVRTLRFARSPCRNGFAGWKCLPAMSSREPRTHRCSGWLQPVDSSSKQTHSPAPLCWNRPVTGSLGTKVACEAESHQYPMPGASRRLLLATLGKSGRSGFLLGRPGILYLVTASGCLVRVSTQIHAVFPETGKQRSASKTGGKTRNKGLTHLHAS